MRNFGGWKSRNFSWKGKIVKIFLKVRKFFENRGEIWNRGAKCIMVSEGDGRPWQLGKTLQSVVDSEWFRMAPLELRLFLSSIGPIEFPRNLYVSALGLSRPTLKNLALGIFKSFILTRRGCLIACLIACSQGHCAHVYISKLIR